MAVLKNVRAYIAGEGIRRADILVREGRIAQIAEAGTAEGEEQYEIPESALVSPGFIDQHIHGAGGADAMDATQEALSTIANTLAKEGTTSFLATTMTQTEENICAALRAADEYIRAEHKDGAAIVGIHLEGPFISAQFRGAQKEDCILPPSVETFRRFNAAAGGHIRLVTVAPEEEGAAQLIEYLKREGIVASIGHSAATFAQVREAAALGAGNVTHTYNAQRPLHHREAGVVGAALLLDELNCELICDTVHVCVPAMRLLAKNKPRGKLTLVTDALRAKGACRDGEFYELGGQRFSVKDGQARLPDGTLAGSVLPMNVAVKNLHEKVGVPLEAALDCASLNPAKNLGLDGEIGSIAAGKRADFAVLGEDLSVLAAIRGGAYIYKK